MGGKEGRKVLQHWSKLNGAWGLRMQVRGTARAPGRMWRPSAPGPPLLHPQTPLPLTSLKHVQHLQKHRREQG